ncbi:MAG: CzcR-like response regulator [Proteobacteria bacterium]|nr:CzcR-like response regulator [Pseudomonadota bacterium]
MNHPLRGTFVGNSIVRLADEGVPIGALSRTFKIPYDSAHGIVRQALEDGMIADMPQADWPAGSRLRTPTTKPIRLEARPDFLMNCKAAFGLTPAEGRLIQCLMQARACTKPHLHAVVAPEAEPKIIDVFVCKIRAKLRKFQVRIETIWGQGYAMPEESKRQLMARIGGGP